MIVNAPPRAVAKGARYSPAIMARKTARAM